MDEDGLSLLQQEMSCEEIHIKVNAIHRLKTVIHSLGPDHTVAKLIPYLSHLISTEDDEVLFAIAEELGQCFDLMTDKTVFLPLLEQLAREDETVVREQAVRSLTSISDALGDAEITNSFCPLVSRLAQSEWFTGRVSSVNLFYPCYNRAGPAKERLRKKFIELCNEDTPMIRRACASKLGVFSTKLEKAHVLQEILPVFRQLSQDE